MKILIFGGSLDPPHRGHLTLLLAAARRIHPDRVLIVPAYHAPLKGSPGASAAHRLEMVRRGLLGLLPKRLRSITRIDTGELQSCKRIYTIDTLARFKRDYPRAQLHFVTGSDAAASFPSWRNPSRLKKLSFWWTAQRGTFKPPSHFKLIPGTMPEISSTELRRRLALGEGVSEFIAKPVASYIEKNGLYGADLLAEIYQILPIQRFKHTLAVARLAEALARHWGLSSDKARLAGLLHDCGRSMPIPKMASYARRYRLSAPNISEIIRYHPLLLHAYISADIAKRRFGIKNPEILSAISKHTLGAKKMEPLDKLLYVADSCSEDRGHKSAFLLRTLAFEDLQEAFRACVSNKVRYIASLGGWIHPLTISLWNSHQD